MVLDRMLAERSKTTEEPRHYADSFIWRIRFAGRQILLQKPLTYMNLSGKAVSKLCREQSLLPQEVLVISDDVDLPFGKIRIRTKGGDGGHNGLSDVIGQLGTQSFNRVRIGIGRCSETNSDMAKFVLGMFTEAEEHQLSSVISTVAEAVKTAIRRGVVIAMNQYNGLDVFETKETNETKEA